jgi:hypothetical protein
MVLTAVHLTISTGFVTSRAHPAHFRSAEQEVWFGHQHLIVHVLCGCAVTHVAGYAKVVVRKFLGLHGGMTDVAFAIAARSFSLGFFGKTGREHAGKNRKDKYSPDKTRIDSNI